MIIPEDTPTLGRVSPAGPAGQVGLAIDRHRTALFIVDVQERLCAAMAKKSLRRMRKNLAVLIEMARRFAMPIVVSQQYPKGLGSTLPVIEDALAGYEHVHRFDKVDFSACEAESFAVVRDAVDDDHDVWIVTGMETHICVYQTARSLAAQGEVVHVPRDAVLSRSKDDWRVGLELIGRAGGIVTSTETVLFDVLRRAGTDDFKALSALVK